MNHDELHINEQKARFELIKEALETADYHAAHYVNAAIANSLYHEETARSSEDAQKMALQSFLIKELLCNIDDI